MKRSLTRMMATAAILGLLSACATHELVRPGARGVHSVTIHSESGEATASSALSQANNYCQEVEKTKTAYILTEKTAYKGSISESDYRAAKTVGNAGMGLIGLGANIVASNSGYNTKMTFTCKPRLSARR